MSFTSYLFCTIEAIANSLLPMYALFSSTIIWTAIAALISPFTQNRNTFPSCILSLIWVAKALSPMTSISCFNSLYS